MLNSCSFEFSHGRHPPDPERHAHDVDQGFGTAILFILQEPKSNSLIALEFREKLAENESKYKLHFGKIV